MAIIVNNNTIIKKKKKLNKEQIILEEEIPIVPQLTFKDHFEQFVNLIVIGGIIGIVIAIINAF
jgi:hypothetical protein